MPGAAVFLLSLQKLQKVQPHPNQAEEIIWKLLKIFVPSFCCPQQLGQIRVSTGLGRKVLEANKMKRKERRGEEREGERRGGERRKIYF